MTLHYLDSSAWVKRYFEEPGSDWVNTLFEENHLLSSSTLGLIEVAATAARKCGSDNAIRLVEIKTALLDDWGSDSVHLASALQLQDDLGIAQEITIH